MTGEQGELLEPPADTPPVKAKGPRPTTRAGRRARGEKSVQVKGDTRRPRSPATAAPKRPTYAELQASLVEALTVPALLLSVRCVECGQHVERTAEAVAASWVEVARVDDRVRRTLERMLTGSAMMTAVMTTATAALPLVAHHTKLPVPQSLAGHAARVAPVTPIREPQPAGGGEAARDDRG